VIKHESITSIPYEEGTTYRIFCICQTLKKKKMGIQWSSASAPYRFKE
jgi:hypothetical protein